MAQRKRAAKIKRGGGIRKQQLAAARSLRARRARRHGIGKAAWQPGEMKAKAISGIMAASAAAAKTSSWHENISKTARKIKRKRQSVSMARHGENNGINGIKQKNGIISARVWHGVAAASAA
jgi:hypothetical protein